MPSKSKKQAKLMRAVAHGWKPSRIKGPTRTVAKEFVDADKRRDKVKGYQFGGGVPYRGVPPQRGMVSRGYGGDPNAMAGRMRGMMPGRGGYGQPGGVPGTIGGYGGYQGGGGGGPQGPQAGALRQMMQQMQQRGGPGGGMPRGGPGGGLPPGIDPRAVAADPQGYAQQQMEARRRGMSPGGGGQAGIMGEGPGGRLEQEATRRRAKMQGPGRFPGAGGPGGRMNQAQNRFGALTQGAPGGGSFGKPTPTIPGRRITGPPGKYPGGGNPMTGGRNPMMRGAQRFGGRRGMRR